jgi:hypothetical protein
LRRTRHGEHAIEAIRRRQLDRHDLEPKVVAAARARSRIGRLVAFFGLNTTATRRT